MVLLAIVLAAGYVGVRGLSAAYAKPERDARTLAAMQQAKQALLGYAANRSRLVGVNDVLVSGIREVPGALPCPGVSLDWLQSQAPPAPQEYGRSSLNCTSVTTRIGRLPWRTLELPELTDSGGEGLWYAVSSNFRQQAGAFPSSRVNSDSVGQIRLRWGGVTEQSRIVAVIIAPGPPLPGQQRGTSTERDDPLNYLERVANVPEPGIDFDFFPGGPTSEAPAFNDLIVTITEAELFDAIENAIALRIEQTVVPALEAHLAFWGTLPYGTGFFDPQTSIGEVKDPATYSPPNQTGKLYGHLPVGPIETRYESFVQTAGAATVACTGASGLPLPDPMLLCSASGAAGDTFSMDVVLSNANAALFDAPIPDFSFPTVVITSITATPIGSTLDASVRIQGTLLIPGTGVFQIQAPVQQLRFAAVPSSDPASWFEYAYWAKFVYYARCSDASATCISIREASGGTQAARAVLVLSGRPVTKAGPTTQVRPSSSAEDYLEPPHHTLPTTAFQRGPRSTSFNDRVVAVR